MFRRLKPALNATKFYRFATVRALGTVTPGLSHVRGVTEPALRSQLIGELFREQANKFQDKEFFYESGTGKRVSWQEYVNDASALATGLLKLGYKPGDRLGIWMLNNYDWIRMKLACIQIGVVVVNVNPAYRFNELKHALNLVGMKGIIVLPEFKTSHYLDMLNELCPEIYEQDEHRGSFFERLRSRQVPSLQHVIVCETDTSYPGAINVEGLIVPDQQIDHDQINSITKTLSPNDAINIQFTSGTTGLPKAATLSHNNVLNNAVFVAERMNFTPEDKLCVPVPMYHCFGDVLSYLACLSSGASFVFPSKTFEPSAVLKTVSEERCTALHGVPTMFIAELEHPDFKKYDLSSLRTGIMAGSPCPIEVMKRVINEMHCDEITICYGMTETSPVSFQTKTNDALERRTQTVGSIHPHLECKAIDEDNQIVKCGEIGELCVKGYVVMEGGYWAQPDQTNEAIDDDGFMHTGDLCTIDEDGFCTITGRAGDMIIRGGENIYPTEVENFLYTHPDIKDVNVIGVPDPKFIEECCAYVIPQEGKVVTAESVREFCKDRIAHFKIPRYVISTETFPMTVTGKIQKFKLQDQFEATNASNNHDVE